jgi:hypothetical protein
LIALPHKVSESECYVNGIEDMLAWKGGTYVDHLLSVVGGMASFSYLKFKSATPPNMVFWGANPRHFIPNLEKIIGFRQVVVEGRGSSATTKMIEEHIDQGSPVVVGALDMFYLHYYDRIYGIQHIPIHYVLVVGYEDEKERFYVHDCGRSGVQEIPYVELQKALDVKVPGMSKKNTIRVFKMGRTAPSELDVAIGGFRLKAKQMLHPPVSIFGIPAMRKLSREVLGWRDSDSFEHMATFATAPPVPPRTFENSHGMRLWQAVVLRKLAEKYGIEVWRDASRLFEGSGELIIQISEAAMSRNGGKIAPLLAKVADLEEEAYTLLERSPKSVGTGFG